MSNVNEANRPEISVLMSVYNGEPFLRKSIESILSQTFTNFEFILIDDFSADNSSSIIKYYAQKDHRIKYIKNPKRFQLTRSLNVGLEIANGKYIARQDADDISLPNRLKSQLKFMKSNIKVGVLGTSAEYIDEKDKTILMSRRPTNQTFLKWKLLFGNPLIHSSIMFHTELVRSLGGYNPKYIRSQDYELWSKCSDLTGISQLPDILIKHRRHSKSIHGQNASEQFETSLKIMHSNIDKLLKTNVEIEHVRLLRRLSSNPLKTMKEYEIAHDLLESITTTFLLKTPNDFETTKMIKSYSSDIVNKWNNEPIYGNKNKLLAIVKRLKYSIGKIKGNPK
tara:strand:+ start:4305 stop:5318 length:1014 start_codon:yes stop_codon:yes gene_type:complete